MMDDRSTQVQDTQPAEPAPRGACWLTIAEAAGRLGVTEQRIRQRCGNEWYPRRLARMEQRPGVRSYWLVREDADPELSRVKFPEQIGLDPRLFHQRQRRTATDRRRILLAWEAAIAEAIRGGRTGEQGTEAFLERIAATEGRSPSRRTLYGWKKRFRAGGLAGLVDHRGRPEGAVGDDDPFLMEVRKLWLHRNRPALRTVIRWAEQKAADRGWTVRSYGRCKRMIDEIHPAEVARMRGGPKRATDETDPYLERDYSTLASNETWVSDHHQFDVIVQDGEKLVRPWVTAWMDMRSRKVVGALVFAHDPNQDTILLAFRKGVLEHGVPLGVYVDNGRDYDAIALQGETKRQRFARRKFKVKVHPEELGGIFGSLGVKTTHCEAYHGQSKPIERLFRTIAEQFCKRFPSYCGSSPQDKPEGLAERLERGKAPTLAEFIEAFDVYINREYNQQPHSGDAMDGQTPEEVWRRNLVAKRTAPELMLALLLTKRSRPVRVQQNGVSWHGLRYGQYAPELAAMMGRQVILRTDPQDISKVTVWTLDDKFICEAPVNQRIPANASEQQLREAISQKRRERKVRHAFFQAQPRLAEDLAMTLMRLSMEKKSPTAEPPDSPPSIIPIRSPLEAEAEKLGRARTRRLAAGAENVDPLKVDLLGNAPQAVRTDPFRMLQVAFPAPEDDADNGPDPLRLLQFQFSHGKPDKPLAAITKESKDMEADHVE